MKTPEQEQERNTIPKGHWVIRATKPNGTTKREVREHYNDAIALAELFDDYYPDRTVTVFFKEQKS